MRKAASNLGFAYNEESKMMYGNYNGYKIIVVENNIYNTYLIKIPCKVNDGQQMSKLNNFLG